MVLQSRINVYQCRSLDFDSMCNLWVKVPPELIIRLLHSAHLHNTSRYQKCGFECRDLTGWFSQYFPHKTALSNHVMQCQGNQTLYTPRLVLDQPRSKIQTTDDPLPQNAPPSRPRLARELSRKCKIRLHWFQNFLSASIITHRHTGCCSHCVTSRPSTK